MFFIRCTLIDTLKKIFHEEAALKPFRILRKHFHLFIISPWTACRAACWDCVRFLKGPRWVTAHCVSAEIVSHLNAPLSHLLTVIVCWTNASRYYKVKNTSIMLSVLARFTDIERKRYSKRRWLEVFKMMSFSLQWTWRRYLAFQRSLLETVCLFDQQSFKGLWWQLHCSSYIGRG